MRMNKEEYQRYLSSSHWQTVRQRALERSSHQCEFRMNQEWYKYEYVGGERCSEKDHLEVHHTRYDNLGKEQPKDVQVLCRRHHLVAEVLKIECQVCGEPIYHDDVKAAESVVDALPKEDWKDSSLMGRVDDELSWDEMRYLEGIGPCCAACAHPFLKED